jgi:hypothetical protein
LVIGITPYIAILFIVLVTELSFSAEVLNIQFAQTPKSIQIIYELDGKADEKADISVRLKLMALKFHQIN